MTTAVQLLSELYSRGVSVSLAGERLLCKAPANALTPELRQRLADAKPEVIAFLKSCQASEAEAAVSVRLDEVALSRSQQRLWFFTQVNPESAAYNTALPIRLKGTLDRVAVQTALRELLRRHDGMRVSFLEGEDGPVARLGPADAWRLSYEDVPSGLPATRRTRALALATQEARRPFDLGAGPLFRATLYTVAPEEHLLLLTIHHIISDGWSLSIVAQEFAALYEAQVTGKPARLPVLKAQYGDWVRWEQEWEKNEAAAHVAYWQGKLAGAAAGAELPSFQTRPLVATYQGKRFRGMLPMQLVEQLQKVSAEHRATLFTTLLAGFKVLLHRYSGLEDIVVGSPVAGRNRSEVEPLIGMFVNAVPMRSDLSGDPRFVDLLVRVRETAAGAHAHSELPFDRLLQELKIAREPNAHPLFKIVFALQNFRQQGVSSAQLEMTLEEIELGITRLDLNLEVYPSPSGYRCEYEYSTDLFTADFVERLHSHFTNLLQGVADNPAARLSELPLLSEAERHKLVFEWNQTAEEPAPFATIAEWFEAQAAITPDKVAVKSWREDLTYGELSRRSQALARRLRESGAGRGAVVAVLLERSPLFAVTVLAILKAGAAYLPLDSSFPTDRLLFMIRDSQAQHVATERRWQDFLQGSALGITYVDEGWEVGLAGPEISEEEPGSLSDSEDIAYVIYTSGSSGTPKGVGIPHRALLNTMYSVSTAPGLRPSDTLLSVFSPATDPAAFELLAPLLAGGSVALIERSATTDPAKLAEAIAIFNVTAMTAAPSLWRMLLDSGWTGEPRLKAMSGGEALSRQLAETLSAKCVSLWNKYGPTETTIWSLIHRFQPEDRHILVGRPIRNTRVYILDNRGNPTPIGVAGELCIGGDSVAPGYRNRAELTRERFVPEAIGGRPEQRMYKTGDIARYHPDGNIELLGRADRQLKLRGNRIELGEIEAVLESHEAIRGALVAGSETPLGASLVAYVLGEEAVVSARELKALVRRKLPRYMVPAHFVYLEKFPLTVQGKVDVRALPQPLPGMEQSSELDSGATPLQQQILRVWQEVLQVERIGLSDQVFDLGAHSLLLVKAQQKLQSQIDVPISVANLFEYPNAESLAQFIEKERSAVKSSQVP